MNTKGLRGRDFITMKGYSKDDLETILNVALELKAKQARREPHPLLAGKILGMLFFSESTRTRVAFESGITQLGGSAQYYGTDQLHLVYEGKIGESWKDTANVLARYIDGLLIRLWTIPGYRPLKYGEARQIMQEFADNANIPVMSGIDDLEHPTQVLADLLTMMEKFGPDYKKKKMAMVWVNNPWGIPPGIPHSLLLAGGALGMKLTFAYPEGYDLDPQYMNEGKKLAKESGGTIGIVHDMTEATKDADVIYAKGWGAIGKSTDEDLKLRENIKGWNVRKEHFKHAARGAIFMHAMPILHREEEREVENEIADGPMSVIYDQAENRMHAVKALMSLIM